MPPRGFAGPPRPDRLEQVDQDSMLTMAWERARKGCLSNCREGDAGKLDRYAGLVRSGSLTMPQWIGSKRRTTWGRYGFQNIPSAPVGSSHRSIRPCQRR